MINKKNRVNIQPYINAINRLFISHAFYLTLLSLIINYNSVYI